MISAFTTACASLPSGILTIGGRLVPFGFIKLADGTLIPDPPMQEHIATAKRLRGEGKSLRTIRDVLASNGCRVSVDALHRTLRAAETHD